MRHLSNWGWMLGVIAAAAMSAGLTRLSEAAPVMKYKVPPHVPRQFSRGDFDYSLRGLPGSLGAVSLGMDSAELVRKLDSAQLTQTVRHIPDGERWDVEERSGAYSRRGDTLWRVQLDRTGKVVAIAGPWWALTETGEAVRPQYFFRDFNDLEAPAKISVNRAMTHFFGAPDGADNFGIGLVQTWDRLPAVLMQVHLHSGTAVISKTRSHRLFADE